MLFYLIKIWKAKLHYNWQLKKDMSSEYIEAVCAFDVLAFDNNCF